VATWLVVYRGDHHGDGRPYDVVEADDVRYDGRWILLSRQVLVIFEPRTVIVGRLLPQELVSLCLLRREA
jgi:hypothetical protein